MLPKNLMIIRISRGFVVTFLIESVLACSHTIFNSFLLLWLDCWILELFFQICHLFSLFSLLWSFILFRMLSICLINLCVTRYFWSCSVCVSLYFWLDLAWDILYCSLFVLRRRSMVNMFAVYNTLRSGLTLFTHSSFRI